MASTDKYFLIGIGGTGMRCLEAVTHMCAMGMFDSKEINILTLDTDFTNGNKQRTETLIDTYNDIKSTPSSPNGNANNNSFFSAKLNKFQFVTNYSDSGKQSFEALTNLKSEGKSGELSENKLLSDLFLGDAVQQFNLEHGYRAQTHMGSYLMYHAFIEVAKKLSKGENLSTMERQFGEFLIKLYDAGADAKIFVLGSIFGGTGASSIPVIPKALNDALKIYDPTMELHPEAKFGATLLTEYFKFKKPDESQKKDKDNAVIADSSFFTLNSQAALQFYEADPTVKKTYKKMYHIGWPSVKLELSEGKSESKTITGGEAQKNDCHITEFLCGCAAWDFFNSDSELDVEEASYLYKAVHYKDGQLDFSFNDFIGKENGLFFAKKFGGFIAFMHLVLSKNNGADGDDGVKGLLGRMSEATQAYTALDSQFTQKLNDYFKSFGYRIESDKVIPGWLYQIKSTVSGNLIMDDGAFTSDIKELSKLEPGNLFPEKLGYEWPTSSRFSSNTFDPFIELLKDEETNPVEEQNVSTTSEKFIAHLYNAIKKSPKKEIN